MGLRSSEKKKKEKKTCVRADETNNNLYRNY